MEYQEREEKTIKRLSSLRPTAKVRCFACQAQIMAKNWLHHKHRKCISRTTEGTIGKFRKFFSRKVTATPIITQIGFNS